MKYIILLFSLIVLSGNTFGQYLKVSKDFYKYPLDSLILYAFPEVKTPLFVNHFEMKFKWEGGFEYRERTGSRDWPSDIKTLIEKNSTKPNFEIEMQSLLVTGKDQPKRDLDKIVLQISSDYEYIPRKPIISNVKPILKDIKAKLMVSKNNQMHALKNTPVDLYHHGHKTSSTVTDESGNFAFKELHDQNNYQIIVSKDGLHPETNQILILAQTSGKPIRELVKAANGNFVFELLESDPVTLALIEDKDETSLPIESLLDATKDEIGIVRNINFDANSAEIHPEDYASLNKMVTFMKENPLYNLEIVGHTDSKGDAAANEKMSTKRANQVLLYFQRKSLPVKRLSSKGKGESQLINRCADGVECSESEHAANRRVEFKFTKIK